MDLPAGLVLDILSIRSRLLFLLCTYEPPQPYGTHISGLGFRTLLQFLVTTLWKGRYMFS